MAYAKGTCVECGLILMCSEGIVPRHMVRGTSNMVCDGSGEETLERERQEEDNEPDTREALSKP